MITKPCTKCGVEKPYTLEFFPVSKVCKNGINPQCRECFNALTRAWKKENRDRLSERRREIYADRYGPVQRRKERERAERLPFQVRAENLQSGIWARSRQRGWFVPVVLRSKQYFIDWLKRQPNCECCGVPFDIPVKRRENSWFVDASPTVDRLNSALPYELDNIALICWRCNNIKRNYAAEDLRRVAEWMDRREATKFDAEAAA